MSLRIHCPNRKCQAKLVIPRTMQGYTVRCGVCGQSFLVPPFTISSLHSRTRQNPPSRKNAA